ncbi:MAG: OB-fold domain-containing protein, partial [Deltaproteobacteria bacterium]|nr:OB-fold domain-containing protein [Deltaproteobacteria bacterium]
VYTYVVYHIAYHPGFKGDLPYVVAIVELAEGPRIFTNIIGCSTDEVYCDMAVEVVWDDVTAELTLPKFRPV